MNIDTGELIRLREGQEAPEGFVKVPEDLQDEANQLLECQYETKVDMKKNTPLVNWAKKKKRAKMAKNSRRKNRKER